MNIDLFYNQYYQNINNETPEHSEKRIYKPHQEIIDFFENNKQVFSYDEFSKLAKYISGDLELTLSDKTIVIIGKNEDMINLLIKSPNGKSFFGCWSSTQDAKKIFEHMK